MGQEKDFADNIYNNMQAVVNSLAIEIPDVAVSTSDEVDNTYDCWTKEDSDRFRVLCDRYNNCNNCPIDKAVFESGEANCIVFHNKYPKETRKIIDKSI